ncbi:hypothetical protein WMW72_26285 [Paenibacillus filicis]|uniref:Uncharacterized protein n=1 Tax=Paenibacillus filicis TaxID=669464 RepID=A0ABU9DRD5_9BACL
MGRDIIDITITKQPRSEITLVLSCYGNVAYGLSDLPNGTTVTLKNGSAEHEARIFLGEGDECAFPYMEIDPVAAKQLRLKDQTRYLAEYNSLQDTVTLTRLLVSRGHGILETDRTRESRITVGASLAAVLGIPWTTHPTLTIRSGHSTVKARLRVPANEISEELRLPASLSRKLGLMPGTPLMLAYNQKTKTLVVGNSAAALDQNQSSGDTTHRSDTNRSGSEPPKETATIQTGKRVRPDLRGRAEKPRPTASEWVEKSVTYPAIGNRQLSGHRTSAKRTGAHTRSSETGVRAGSRIRTEAIPRISRIEAARSASKRKKGPAVWLSPQVVRSL